MQKRDRIRSAPRLEANQVSKVRFSAIQFADIINVGALSTV